VNKPEITGYEFDPFAHAVMDMPELTYDSDGVSIEAWDSDKNGYPFSYRKYLTNTELDQLMRAAGMKRVYKERRFHARYETGHNKGWLSVTCRTCNQTTAAHTGHLPHDVAMRHALEDCPLRHIMRKPPQYLIDEYEGY